MPGRRHRDPRRRACGSRPCGSPPRCGRCCSPTRARRTSAPATSTPRSAPTRSASSGCAESSAGAPLRRGARLRRAAHAGRAGATLPDGAWTFDRRASTRFGPGADQQDPTAIAVAVTHRRRRDHVRLHRHRRAARRQRQRGRGGDGQRGRVRAAVGDSTRRSRPTAARCGRCTVIAPAGTIVAARPPAAVGAGNVEVSQRVADVCLGALAQARARTGSARRRRGR